MTPKQKAEELAFKFSSVNDKKSIIYGTTAKYHALIAVDEIINHKQYSNPLTDGYLYYWLQVKEEIEKI